MENLKKNNRLILLVDDNNSIHEDYRDILQPKRTDAIEKLDSFDKEFFDEEQTTDFPKYELESVFQGRDALENVKEARKCNKPFAVAFVDVRMPPGWDGIETIKRIWEVDDEILVVICTAYSDYSWEEIYERFGKTNRLLFIRKPFDRTEVRQLALMLTEKWNLARFANLQMTELDEMVKKRTYELEKALSDVKKLSGLLPICANCKKIRDDKGYWNQIETYIKNHSEAEFSHGICPDCINELYPDLCDDFEKDGG